MADIELVIRIDKVDYRAIKNKKVAGDLTIPNVFDAIRNGTLLPEGHGKLIFEPTEKEIAKTIGGRNDFADCIRDAVKTVFANAPTIIEADKEDE